MQNHIPVYRTHRTAQNEDVPHICMLLEKGLAIIYVRDLNRVGDTFLFAEIAEGPFTTEFISGHHVLHGRDRGTKERKSLRITGKYFAVELSSHNHPHWYPASLGAIRLLIPK